MSLLENHAEILARFEPHSYFSADGRGMCYRLFRPACAGNEKHPLVVFLHGMGERGADNEIHVTNNGAAQLWSEPAIQAETPCYILAPQCPADMCWTDDEVASLTEKLIRDIISAENIDPMRVYVCGISMGGCGSWHMAAEYPALFAAAMPICGAASVHDASRIGQMPLWAAHAADDPVVPVNEDLATTIPVLAKAPRYGSRAAVLEAVRCGSRNVKYTEYPAGYISGKYGGAHASWEEAFRDDEMRRWLFSQSRLTRSTYKNVLPGVWACDDSLNSSYYIVEGRNSALVIDTGMGHGDINAFVESITRLPYALALTHGHFDHSLHAAKFEKCYLDMADKDMVEGGTLCPISDGYTFDLGGGVTVETVALPGHTQGSVLFVDKFHRCVFTGDAVGSGCGVWMQVPTGSKLSEYKAALEKAHGRLIGLGVDDSWAFLGGHDGQQFQSGLRSYNPICMELLADMAALCEKIISGEIVGSGEGLEGVSARFGETLKAGWGTAEMLYRPEQAK